MNEKKEKSQCQIRFPYCGAVAVIRSTAEIYKAFSVDDELYVCSNDPDCKSYVAIQGAHGLAMCHLPTALMHFVPYISQNKVQNAQIMGSFPKINFPIKVKKTPDFLRNQVFFMVAGEGLEPSASGL